MTASGAPVFSFEVPEAVELAMVPLAMRGREAVSALHRFEVDLRVDELDPAVLARALLGQRAAVRLHGDDGVARTVWGVVTRVSLRGHVGDGRHARCRLRVEPAMALLRRARRSRVFQDLSIPQVIDAVLAGHPLVRRAWKLSAAYAPRPYCVQHQETDLGFVTRLLAEEGVRFHFEHDLDGETAVLSDAASFARPLDGSSTLVYREAEERRDERSVTRFARTRTIREGRAAVRGFDWRHPERPQAAETAAVGAPAESALEFYEHHGEHEESRVARDVAALHLQQHRRRAELADGRSACPRLMPGRSFTLDAPAFPTAEGDYTVLSVEHRARQSDGADGGAENHYENRFIAMPKALSVRPARPARRLQQVLETATVTGPADEEVWTDEHGRIKVQFHWDREGARDEHSSCWIRTMQPWAGASYGAQFVPRVGTEVVVSFLGGDVDRPVVLGSLYNGTHPVPFTLPERRTRSGIRTRSSPGGEGYNELSFEDAAGQEEIRIHAAHDLRETVRHDQSVQVDGGRTITVGGDLQEAIGGNRVETVRGERAATVMGGETLLVLGDRRVDVDGAMERSVRGDGITQVAGGLSVRVSGAVDVTVATGGEVDATLTVGGSWRTSVQDDVVIQARRSLVFMCGENRVEIDHDGVRVHAKKIELAGTDEVLVRTPDAALRLDDDAELTADAVKLYGPGSKLELTGEATLRGAKVHVGRGSGKPVRFVNDDPREAIFRFVQNRAREPIANLRVRIRHPDGTEHEHVTDGLGYVRIPGAAQSLYEILGVVGDGARDFVRHRARRS